MNESVTNAQRLEIAQQRLAEWQTREILWKRKYKIILANIALHIKAEFPKEPVVDREQRLEAAHETDGRLRRAWLHWFKAQGWVNRLEAEKWALVGLERRERPGVF